MNTRATAFLRRPVPYACVFNPPSVGCTLETKSPPQNRLEKNPSEFFRVVDEFITPRVAASALHDVPGPYRLSKRGVFEHGWREGDSWATSPELLRVSSSQPV